MEGYATHLTGAHLEIIVDLLVDEDEGEHGSTEAPLVAALFKQHYLKQSPAGHIKDGTCICTSSTKNQNCILAGCSNDKAHCY